MRLVRRQLRLSANRCDRVLFEQLWTAVRRRRTAVWRRRTTVWRGRTAVWRRRTAVWRRRTAVWRGRTAVWRRRRNRSGDSSVGNPCPPRPGGKRGCLSANDNAELDEAVRGPRRVQHLPLSGWRKWLHANCLRQWQSAGDQLHGHSRVQHAEWLSVLRDSGSVSFIDEPQRREHAIEHRDDRPELRGADGVLRRYRLLVTGQWRTREPSCHYMGTRGRLQSHRQPRNQTGRKHTCGHRTPSR